MLENDTGKVFMVWYDPFFEQWFVCPKKEATDKLVNTLKDISLVIRETEANSEMDALNNIKKKVQLEQDNKNKNNNFSVIPDNQINLSQTNHENNLNDSFAKALTGATIKSNRATKETKELINKKDKIYISAKYSKRVH